MSVSGFRTSPKERLRQHGVHDTHQHGYGEPIEPRLDDQPHHVAGFQERTQQPDHEDLQHGPFAQAAEPVRPSLQLGPRALVQAPMEVRAQIQILPTSLAVGNNTEKTKTITKSKVSPSVLSFQMAS